LHLSTRCVLCGHRLDPGSYGHEATLGGWRTIFSDLAYTDDTALLFSSEDNIAPCLHSFSQAAATLRLRTSWAKTKLQNLGSGPSPTSLQIDGNSVESVDSFVYLGSLQKSEDNSRPDMKHTISISLAASVMSSLIQIWRDKILQLCTAKALVMSVLLYAAQTWTLLLCEE